MKNYSFRMNMAKDEDFTRSTYTDESPTRSTSSARSPTEIVNNMESSPLFCCGGHFEVQSNDDDNSFVKETQKQIFYDKVNTKASTKAAEVEDDEDNDGSYWYSIFTEGARLCMNGNDLGDFSIQYIYCNNQDTISDISLPRDLRMLEEASTQRLVAVPSTVASTANEEVNLRVYNEELRRVPSIKNTASASGHTASSLNARKIPSLKTSGSFFKRRRTGVMRASPIHHDNGLIEI